jgi:hypothetical protein
MNKNITNYIYNYEDWENEKTKYYKPLIDLAKSRNKLIKDCIPITER